MSNQPPSYLGVPAIYGGYGFGGSSWVVQPIPGQPDTGKPPTGISPVASQRVGYGNPNPIPLAPFGGPLGPFGAPGGGVGCGIGFGGQSWGAFGLGSSYIAGQWPRGWVLTYRMMDFDALLSRCKSRYITTLASNPVIFTANQALGGTDDDVAFCKALFSDAFTTKLKVGCCESLSYGKAAFEKVWANDGGGKYKWYYEELDPQWPDGLQICKYKDGPATGKFAGVIPFGGSMNNMLDERKSWLCTWRGAFNNFHGVAFNETAYDSWTQDNAVSFDEWKLRGKVSNVIPIIKYPTGTTDIVTEGGTVKRVDNLEVAQQAVQNISALGGIALPMWKFEPQDIKAHPELASVPVWTVDWYDAGTLASAMAGYVSKHDSLDKRKCEAWWLSSLGNIENTKGGLSQGDSAPHADADMDAIEFVDIWFCLQIQSLIDDLMVTNGRPKGCVTIKAKSYFDAEQENSRATINAAIASPVFAPNMAKILDIDQMCKDGGFKTIPGQTWAGIMKQQADQDAETHQATIEQMKQPKVLPGAAPNVQPNGKPMNRANRLPAETDNVSEN